jgi:hypothetical protein
MTSLPSTEGNIFALLGWYRTCSIKLDHVWHHYYIRNLTSNEILDWIYNGGYDTRSGATRVHPGLQQSPQTEHQRAFVKEFVGGVQTIARRL